MRAHGPHFGDYTVVQRLGAGAMAEVYLCQLDFDEQVVVRQLRPELLPDPTLVELFLDEARTAGRLEHPNIVALQEIAWSAGSPYVVMEYVRGPTLARIIRAIAGHKPRYYGELAQVMAAIARGLHHAHTLCGADGEALGLVHGEVSVRSIVVTDAGVPKLLDFGVARARAQVAGGVSPASAAYLAPEQLAVAAVDHRADVFAMGACLYHATTGVPPFAAGDDSPTRRPLRRPGEMVADYPRELERIIQAAMEPDPERRLPSAEALADELERFIALPEIAKTTRRLPDFLGRLLLDVEEPVTFGSDDGYVGSLVARLAAPVAAAAASSASGVGGATLAPRQVTPLPTETEVPAAPARPSEQELEALRPRRPGRVLLIAGLAASVMFSAVLLVYLLKRRPHAPAVSAPVRAPLATPVVEPLPAAASAPSVAPPAAMPAPTPIPTPIPLPPPAAPIALAAPVPTAAPAPAAPRSARLSVASAIPGTIVFLDGNRLGRAPIRRHPVTPGNHVIEFRRDGFAADKRSISFSANRETTLQARLQRAPSAGASASAAPAAAASPAAAPSPRSSPSAEPSPSASSAAGPSAIPDEPSPRGSASPSPSATAPPPASASPSPSASSAPRATASPSPSASASASAAPSPSAPPTIRKVAVPTPLRLPASYGVRSAAELDKMLAMVEREAVMVGKAPAAIVKGVTRGLGQKLRGEIAPGIPLEIRPADLYALIVRAALQGYSASAIKRELERTAH